MTYKLKILSDESCAWPTNVMILRDTAKKLAGKAELQAQVASKDYFAFLASRLDQISQSLQKQQHSDYVVLEETIDDLLYLQEHYQVVKKKHR